MLRQCFLLILGIPNQKREYTYFSATIFLLTKQFTTQHLNAHLKFSPNRREKTTAKHHLAPFRFRETHIYDKV